MRTLLVLGVLLVAHSALAQIEPPDAPKVQDDNGAPRVYYAHSYFEEHWTTAGLDDLFSVHVQNFPALLKQANDMCSGIVLFIDGMAIKGLQPSSCDAAGGHVRYRLLRTQQSDDVWRLLLGSPSHYLRPVSISVGATDQFSVPSNVTAFQLEIIPRSRLFLFVGISVGGALLFLWLCRKGGLIRSGPATLPVLKQPYNLSLFQMAFWFFLVVTAYLFIWMINDELDTITDSVLALLGIGAGTALGSALIDQSKQTAGDQPSAAVPPEAGKPLESRGFIRDLLTDASGTISLHRFQLFVWTLVLGVIFCASVYRQLEMPNFSATLLGLMGISSGTYLGFKVPEGKKAPEPAPAPASGGSGTP
ncbi:MAG: hypothetical protein ACJ8AT_01235 [Hyalangium sp.]|uniref:hypothetical protein n=1 Tax=Hyalangium sp. TaxID=2028555 RepID=UPI00389A7A15